MRSMHVSPDFRLPPECRDRDHEIGVGDRPVSEIVRRAVDRYLLQAGEPQQTRREYPTFHGGEVQVAADKLKARIYDDDTM